MGARFYGSITLVMAVLSLAATVFLLATLVSCGPNQAQREDYRSGVEAWVKKNKLEDPIANCVSDTGDCSVSWTTPLGRRVAGVRCRYVNGPGSVECWVP